MLNVEATIRLLQSRGLRMTPVRSFILELFKNSKRPLSANDVITELSKANIRCNRTTVFRELTALHDQGVFRTADFGDGIRRYEPNAGPHHHHFLCTECKSVIDVNLKNDLETEERLLEKIYHVTIRSHSLEFFGVCATCQGKMVHS